MCFKAKSYKSVRTHDKKRWIQTVTWEASLEQWQLTEIQGVSGNCLGREECGVGGKNGVDRGGTRASRWRRAPCLGPSEKLQCGADGSPEAQEVSKLQGHQKAHL